MCKNKHFKYVAFLCTLFLFGNYLLYMTCVTIYNVTTKNINAPMNMEIFKIKTASA